MHRILRSRIISEASSLLVFFGGFLVFFGVEAEAQKEKDLHADLSSLLHLVKQKRLACAYSNYQLSNHTADISCSQGWSYFQLIHLSPKPGGGIT